VIRQCTKLDWCPGLGKFLYALAGILVPWQGFWCLGSDVGAKAPFLVPWQGLSMTA